MHAPAKQFQSEFLVRLGGHDHHAKGWVLPQQIGNRLDRIGGDCGFKKQNVRGKLLGGGQGLEQGFSLANHADIIFQSKDFAQAGAKDRLGIGHDHADELAIAITLVRRLDDSRGNRSARH